MCERNCQCLGVIAEICTRLEQEVEIQDNKDFHTFSSFEKDLSIILEQLARDDLLDNIPRGLMSYKKCPIFQSFNLKQLTTWIGEKIINLDVF